MRKCLSMYFGMIFSVISATDGPVVDIHLPGMLGNRLFAFCIGNIIAEKLGFKCYCGPIKGFPYSYSCVDNKPSPSYKTQTIDTTHGQAIHDIDIEKVTSDRSPRNIKLIGYFQRYKYLRSYREKIRTKWLALDSSMAVAPQDPQDIVIHVRANHPSVFVPFEYYEKALASTSYRRVFICTDEPKDPFLDKFKKYNPIIHSTRSLSQLMHSGVSWGDISSLNLDEFLFMCSFNKIITSHSTFAWWAAFLSDAQEIYAPYSSDERYQVYGKVDEDRYHYIDTIIGHP